MSRDPQTPSRPSGSSKRDRSLSHSPIGRSRPRLEKLSRKEVLSEILATAGSFQKKRNLAGKLHGLIKDLLDTIEELDANGKHLGKLEKNKYDEKHEELLVHEDEEKQSIKDFIKEHEKETGDAYEVKMVSLAKTILAQANNRRNPASASKGDSDSSKDIRDTLEYITNILTTFLNSNTLNQIKKLNSDIENRTPNPHDEAQTEEKFKYLIDKWDSAKIYLECDMQYWLQKI